jgi:hypothetical protein
MAKKQAVEVAKVVYVKMMAAEKTHYEEIAAQAGFKRLGTFLKQAAAFYAGYLEGRK